MKTIIFFVFLFAALVLGGYQVGPFSIRVYLSLMFFLVILNSKVDRLRLDIQKFTSIYWIFIVISAFCLLLNGEFTEANFIKKFLAYYFPSLLVLYGANDYMKSFTNIRYLLGFLCGIGVLTSIVTWLQYVDNPLGSTIGLMFINSTQAQESIQETMDVVLSGGAYGSGVAIGIMGFAFTNAYFISSVGPIPFLFREKRYFPGSKYIVYSLFGLLFVACFMAQERSCFFALLAVDLFLLGGFFTLNKNRLNRFFIALLILVIVFFFESVSKVDMGRLTEISATEDTRNVIWKQSLIFLQEHWFLGGPVAFDRTVAVPSHNFFLIVFINAGLIGGIIASYVYLKMWVSALYTVVKNNIRMETRMVACCLMVSLFYSLFHNATFAEGDILQILLCIMHLKTKELENDLHVV